MKQLREVCVFFYDMLHSSLNVQIKTWFCRKRCEEWIPIGLLISSVFSGTLNRVKYSTKSCSSSTMRQKWRRIGDIANSRTRSRRRRPAKVLPIKCYCYWWVLWTGIKSSGQEGPATQPSEKTQPKDKWTEANGSRGVVINSFVLAGIASSGRKRSWGWGCLWVVG